MTYQEVYDQIVFDVWGGSTPPAPAIPMIHNFIKHFHRELQKDYNYWFMQTYDQILTVAGYSGYPLPDIYKEVLKIVSITDGVFSEPLEAINYEESTAHWNLAEGVPTAYEIFDNTLMLYPKSNIAVELHISYWGFVPLDTEDEDKCMTQAGDIIANRVAGRIYRSQKEWQSASSSEDLANKGVERLRELDRAWRQRSVEELNYGG